MLNLKKRKKCYSYINLWKIYLKVTNDFLEIVGLFIRVYKRGDKFQYVIKKNMQDKNNIIRCLSSRVIQKFSGYEILKTQFKNEEKRCHEPVDIIYELVNDERSIKYYFTSNLHLAYRSYCSKKVKDDYRTYHLATRKCYDCD